MGNIENEKHLELGERYLGEGLKSFDEGMKLKKNGSFKEAIAKFENAHKECSDGIVELTQIEGHTMSFECFIDLKFYMASAMHELGNYDGAINQYNEIADNLCFQYRKRECLAKTYCKRGDSNRALIMNSIFVSEDYSEATIKAAINAYSEAILAFNAITHIDVRKDLADVHYKKGNVHIFAKDYPSAISSYTNAINAYITLGDKENLADVYYNIGCAYHESKNHPSAIEYFTKAIDNYDDESVCVYFRNYCCQKHEFKKSPSIESSYLTTNGKGLVRSYEKLCIIKEIKLVGQM